VRIAPEAKVEQNVTLFDVIVMVDNSNGKLKSGMNTSIEITILRRENVLLVPAMAVRTPPRDSPRGANAQMVLLKTEEGFRPQRVETGPSNFQQTVILSGVQSGDIVGVPMTSRLMEANARMEDRIRSSLGFNPTQRPSR